MSWIETLLTGLALGLAGSLHCVGMCGAIVTALSFSAQKQSFGQATITTLVYNTGRIMTYVMLGAIAGVIGSLGDTFGVFSVLRIVAALLLMMTGFYLTGWWQGLLLLERLGQNLWHRLKPLTQSLSPARSLLHAFASGMLWGMIPCGLVYSALGIATAQGEMVKSLAFMLAFGAGTFAPMVFMGIGFTRVAQWLKKPWIRYCLALSLILFGGWSLYSNVTQGNHSSHMNHPSHQEHRLHYNHSEHNEHSGHEQHDKNNAQSVQDDSSNNNESLKQNEHQSHLHHQ
jgi:hypothetical protein